MRQNLLLLQDVIDLGRAGEIVSVKSGYARNFLLPLKKGVIAGEQTMRMQKRLQEERAKQAVTDKVEAEALAKVIELISLQTHAKVDPEGKMYGSVSQQDIVDLLAKHDIKLDRKDVQLKHAIKETGTFDITFRLKEGVPATCKLEILPEGGKVLEPKKTRSKKEKEVAVSAEEVVVEEIEEENIDLDSDEENPPQE
jgi:large subunit ribosomal protein L9